MSIAPHTGIVDFGTFTAPTASTDGIQGEVPQPLAGQEGYVLTGTGWASAGSVGLVGYQGTWNALTNTPTLTSSVGVQGYYYVVDVAGTTNLNGITDWQVGDWAIFNGSIWQKVDNTDSYDPANVAITGGTINNTTVGATTPSTGVFTTLTAQNETLKGTGQNLILRSQQFSNVVYSSSTATRTDNQTTAPDGTSTGALIQAIAGSYGGLVRQFTAPYVPNTTYTISVYAKAGTSNFVGLRASGGCVSSGDNYCYFNLSTGVATAITPISGAIVSVAMTNAGNGWYRCSVAYTTGATISNNLSDFSIVTSNGGTNPAYAGTETIFAWGLQVELGSVLNTYIPTTTTAVYGTPTLSFSGVASIGLQSDGSLYETSAGTGNVRFYTNNIGQEQLRVAHTASAVNYAQLTGAVTGGNVQLSAQGSDSSVGISLVSKGGGGSVWKGDGGVYFQNNAANNLFSVENTASTVNRLTATGGATGFGPRLYAQGSDTNISQVFQSKGTGAIDLAAGSSGVNISNGGTVTAITRTAAGGGTYTSKPTVVISAPTTAGGVQATATVDSMGVLLGTVQSGGTGYTVGDSLSVVGGTGSPQFFTVSTVSGGVVTGIANVSFASYTVLPTNPVSTTGGTGSGCTLNLGYNVGTTYTITNAGSGYVEQPTVTFSGGGGSGAAAYATVGSSTVVRTLGGTMDFSTPSGRQFQVSEQFSGGSTAANYIQVSGRGAGAGPTIGSQGTDTNISVFYIAKGSGSHLFTTSAGAVNQFEVAHTASAVNFVQVRGAATGSTPIISIQGSDAVITGAIQTKGGGSFSFYSQANLTARQVRIDGSVGNAVNYLDLYGAAASGAPSVRVGGSDTNIDLNLTPKGTGSVVSSINGGTFTAARDSANNRVQLRSNGNLGLFAQSGGAVGFYTNTAGDVLQMQVAHTASAVNFLQAAGSVTGSGVTLSAQGSDTNIPLVLQPKGTGALQAQQTDSTATGGNARGARAVDWQTLRSNASEIASGFVANITGGYANTASGGVSGVLSGTQNNAAASLSVISGGIGNTTTGSNYGNSYSFVGSGYTNTAGGVFNFIGGGYLNSGTSATAVTTQSATMNATTAVTLAASNASIKVGQIIAGTSISSFPPTYVAAVSGTSLTLSQAASGSSTSTLSFYTPHGVVVGGGNNQATGSYSFIGGGGDAGTAANRNVASGDWSVVCGGHKNVASGQSAFVGAGGDLTAGSIFGNTASGVASGVVTGANNIAAGYGSFVGGGSSNSGSGTYSGVVFGNSNAANADYSSILGGSQGTTRGIIGSNAQPYCNNPLSSPQGASQGAALVLAVQTTDATATVLRSNTSAAGTTNQVILPNNSAYYFKVEIIANVTGGGNTSGWELKGVIKRGANAASTTIVGSVTSTLIAQDAGASTWAVSATADTTNGGLKITCTGQASTTIRWVAKASTTEVTF